MNVTIKSVTYSILNDSSVIPFYSRFTPNGIERGDFLIGGLIFFVSLFILKLLILGKKRRKEDEK